MRTDSLRSRFFAAFEGSRSAYPIAVFRVLFFGGLALHFFPSLIHLDENYTAGALRTEEWNHWLYGALYHVPHATLRMWSIATMVACILAIVGLWPRVSAIVAGIGFYMFASFNGRCVQTLALVDAWAILLAWMICGGGAEALSVEAFLRKRKASGDTAAEPPTAPKLLSALVLYQAILGTFFAGVEKVLAGWPWSNEMGILLAYPRGFIVRDWVAASSWLDGSVVTHAFTWLTLVVEIGAPLAFVLGRPRTRLVALVAYEAFFLGIVAMLQVPPLFYFIFAGGGLLVLDDEQVAAIAARLRGLRGRVAWSSTLGLLLACRSSGGGPASSPPTPCGDYFDAIHADPCGTGPTLPASEATRQRARFDAACAAYASLPGSGMTDADLEACAAAIQAAGCGGAGTTPAACEVLGTLPTGAACNETFQCQSGACFQSAAPPMDDGGVVGVGDDGGSSGSCGQCPAAVGLGQPCRENCATGSVCAYKSASPICVVPTFGGTGAACDGVTAFCGAGLYCDASGECTALRMDGQACASTGQCAPPSTCIASACRAPGGADDACSLDDDCGAGLGCSIASSTCGTVSWASGGQPCGDLARCLVGLCSDAMTCPSVLADGQPCSPSDSSSTCDVFAECTGGTCVPDDQDVCM